MRYKKIKTIERPGKRLVIEYQGKEIPYTIWEEHQKIGPEIVDDKQSKEEQL